LQIFQIQGNKEGYWNFDHAAPWLEDVVDCLVIFLSDMDFVILFDQSSGHGK